VVGAPKIEPGDVVIESNVRPYTTLDLGIDVLDTLVQRGRDAARRVLAAEPCLRSIKETPPGPRSSRLVEASVSGVRPSQETVILRTLRLSTADSLDEADLRRRLLRFSQFEQYRALWLQPAKRDDGLAFGIEVRQAPRRAAAFGAAYDNTMAGRLWFGAADRRLLGTPIEAGARMGLGQYRQDLELAFLYAFPISYRYSPLMLTAGIAREEVRQFVQEGELGPITTREFRLFAGTGRRREQGWRFRLGPELLVWHEDTRGDNTSFGGRGVVEHVGPPQGILLRLDGAVTTAYESAALEAAVGLQIEKLLVQPRVRFGWASDGTPLQSTFPLGGDEGFPGLRLTERRGLQELLFGLAFIHPVVGPVTVRVEGMAGAVSSGDGFLERGSGYDGEWLEGVRGGVEVRTPIGPVRLEEGVDSKGDWEGFVRVGTWF